MKEILHSSAKHPSGSFTMTIRIHDDICDMPRLPALVTVIHSFKARSILSLPSRPAQTGSKNAGARAFLYVAKFTLCQSVTYCVIRSAKEKHDLPSGPLAPRISVC